MGRLLEFGAEKKAAFLAALGRTECIRAAAAEVGVLPGSVAWARRRDRGFRRAFDEVIEQVRDGQALVRLLALPRVEERADGFTAEKRRKFIKALGKTGCISDAARIAGISTTSVRRWRDRDEEFARLFHAALSKAGGPIETLAWERAVTGIDEPVWAYGKRVGTRRKRSDAIFRMLLIASDPGKYGPAASMAQGPSAVRRGVGKRPRIASNAEVKVALTRALAAFGARVTAEDEAQARIEQARLADAARREGAAAPGLDGAGAREGEGRLPPP